MSMTSGGCPCMGGAKRKAKTIRKLKPKKPKTLKVKKTKRAPKPKKH